MFKGATAGLSSKFGKPLEIHAETSIYKLVWKLTRYNQLALVSMAILVVPLSIVPLELQKRIIDQGILEKNVRLMVLLLVAYVAVAGLQALSLYILNMLEGRVHEVVARRLRHRVLRLIRRKREEDLPDVRAGTVVTLYAMEVDPIGEFAGQAISVPTVEGGIFLAVMGYMIYTEPLLAAVALTFFVPQIILVPVIQRRINQRTGNRIKLLRQTTEETLGILDRRPGFGFPFVVMATRTIFALRIQIYRLKYFMKYAVLFLIFASRIAVLGAGGYMVMNDQTSIGVIVAFLTALDRLTARWSELISFFRRMSDARLKYDLVFDILRPGATPRAG